jgi:sugar phosphate isomerase/epimerase
VLVLSAVTGAEGYDTPPGLDDDGWRVLLANLDRLATLAAGRGVRAVLHPHVGTMVENGAEVGRVLEGSSISLCLDTGHLLIGAVPTRPSWPARRPSGSSTSISRTSTPASPGGSKTAG